MTGHRRGAGLRVCRVWFDTPVGLASGMSPARVRSRAGGPQTSAWMRPPAQPRSTLPEGGLALPGVGPGTW